jgi:prepilin-type N-terminal cleavage/methylation domain-containing protein
MEAMIRRILSSGPKGLSIDLPLSGYPRYVSRQRGFTLVEVMMSVVLMGIGMALALPSYRDMVEKRQITNGAEQLASFINTAQGVAMKTNRWSPYPTRLRTKTTGASGSAAPHACDAR